MNDLPRWSLDTIYPSVDSPEFSDDLDKVRSLASALAAEPDLALFDELTALMVNLDAYVSALISTDSENEAYLKALSAVEDAEVIYKKAEDRFTRYIGQTEAGTTRFGFSASDTTGFVGVRAIYGQDSSLLCCVPIRKGAPEASNQEQPESASSLKFWVNQAERSLHLSDGNWHRLEIFDVKGRLVMEKEYGAGSVSLQGLPSGLYLCRVWNGPEPSTFKFVLP